MTPESPAVDPKDPWPRCRLDDLVDDRGITYGVVQPGQPQHDGIPILRVANLTPAGLRLNDVLRIDPTIAEKYGRSKLIGDEVVITLVGSVGQVAVVPSELAGWNVARAVGVIPVRPDVPSRWVAWCLRCPEVQRYLDARLNTTVQSTLNLRDLASVEIPMPPPQSIRRIASVLEALDDKIASNQRLAMLLEEATAATFKARFVDFLGIEEFEQHGTARTPKGWEVGGLNDVGRFVNGKAFTKDANGGGRAILRIRELNSGIDGNTPRSDTGASDDHIASVDDILFAWSGSLGVYRWSGPESLINQHIFKVIPDGWPAWFVYGWIQEHMPEFRAIAQDKATTMGHIQRRHLAEAVVPIPDDETISEADDVLKWLDEHRRTLVAEAGALRAVRDRLLPKLISGEMRVPDTTDPEEVIGPATDQLVGAAR
jgi:type I restriction enzyme, S subunit